MQGGSKFISFEKQPPKVIEYSHIKPKNIVNTSLVI